MPADRLPSLVDIDRALIERGTLEDYIQIAWGQIDPSSYVHGWHVGIISEYLTAISTGEIRKLLINIPPGFSKSSIVSVLWPSWDWIRTPERKIIAASYDAKLALRDAKRMRDLVLSSWYRARWGDRVRISPGQAKGMGAFRNDQGGHRFSTGVGAGFTGWHADVHICDDPHRAKDVQGSADKVRKHLEDAKVWWSQTMPTRATNRATLARVVVMQRLHEADLSQVCLEEGGYEHLCLPLHYQEYRGKTFSLPTPGDLRSTPGELLCEARINDQAATELRKELGSAAADAQLEQRPASEAGRIIQRAWLTKYWRELPQGGQFLQSWDMAFKGGASSDPVAGQVWYAHRGVYYLVDQICRRMSMSETVAAVISLTGKWPKALGKIVEDKANGPAVVDMLHKAIPGLVLVSPEGGKEARAHAVAPLFEAGSVLLPDPALHPWVHDYIEELATFPGAPHDDQLDATTQILLYLHVRRSRFGEAMAAIRDTMGA